MARNSGKVHVVRVSKTGYVDKQGRRRDYSSAYLRRTYRDGGTVKNETVANIFGLGQRPRLWAAAAGFAARALDEQPHARVLIHFSAGRRRSAMLAYAVLRLPGRTAGEAASLVLRYRAGAQLVPAYVHSVERWLAREPAALRRH